MRPLIAVSLDICTDKTYSKIEPWYALRQSYAQAIIDAGGIPIALPHEKEGMDFYLEIAQGFVIPGGDYDIDPKHYGTTKTALTRELNEGRVAFESNLITAVLERQKPLLAICAGMQLLNVVLGGTLYQDITAESGSQISHEMPNPHQSPAHKVHISNGSLLESISGQSEAAVNSTHHQACRDLGRELTATAKSEDGIIEAIELSTHPFVLGVEWHPEYRLTSIDRDIWKSFIQACL